MIAGHPRATKGAFILEAAGRQCVMADLASRFFDTNTLASAARIWRQTLRVVRPTLLPEPIQARERRPHCRLPSMRAISAGYKFDYVAGQVIVNSENLAELYELPLLDWASIEARLDRGVNQAPGSGGPDRHTCWLATINDDGSPHSTGIGAVWFNGSFWFVTGAQTRKGRNLARDPRCTLSMALHEFDLTVDGTAELIEDPATVATLARRWVLQGWPAEVDTSGIALTAEYSAPSAGPPPWRIYRIIALQATALATVGVGGATRWKFSQI